MGSFRVIVVRVTRQRVASAAVDQRGGTEANDDRMRRRARGPKHVNGSMRKAALPVLAAALCLIFATAPTSASDPPEQRMFDLVNAERAHHQLPPLTVSDELVSSARAYAQSMAEGGFFGHVGPDGSTLVTRNEAAGYRNWTFLAENLAAGQVTPNEAVAALMASTSHRAIILSSRIREIGIGYVYHPGSKYQHYWVQEFGDRRQPWIGLLRPTPDD